MNVTILSSSKSEIDEEYISLARRVSKILSLKYNLIYGASSTSMMGACYDEFSKKGKEVYAYTTKKYEDDLVNLKKAKHGIVDTTFDLKKKLIENSDLIVALPGGVGTISEILSYIEEIRSNDLNIPLIIYDENNFYEDLIKMIEKQTKEKFITENIYDYIKIIKTIEDLKKEVI